MMGKLTGYGLVFIFALTQAGCTKWLNPEKSSEVELMQTRVREFVTLSANAQALSDKSKLEGFCTGDLAAAFQQMSDEVFRLSYLESELTIEEISFLKHSVEPKEGVIHYRVKVVNNAGLQPTIETIEREVHLAQHQGEWRLSKIKPINADKLEFVRGMVF